MEIPFNRLARISAHKSFGTCMTVMDDGTTVKLMKTADEYRRQNFLPPFDALNQFFTLVPASDTSFRIVSAATHKCFDFGDWFFNPDKSRTNVRHLVLKDVDQSSQTQIFRMQSPYTQGGNDCAILATADGIDFELRANDWGAKEWVLITLAKHYSGTGEPYVVEPKPLADSVRGIRVHNTGAFLMDFHIHFSRPNARGQMNCPSFPDEHTPGKAGVHPKYGAGDYRTIDLASSSYGTFNPSPYAVAVEIYPYAFVEPDTEHGAEHNVIYDPNSNLYAVYNCKGTFLHPLFDYQGVSSDPT